MSWQVIEATGEALEAALETLLAEEPHLEYANFRPIAARGGAAAALHRERWRVADGRIACLVVLEDGRPRAALRLAERPFESRHFGLRMARIDPPVATDDPPARALALAALYRAGVARARDAGWEHLAARCSSRDREAAWSAQEAGGRWVDTQVSWMCPLTGADHAADPSAERRIEVCDRNALAALPEDAWKRLADWGGDAFDRGPLVFDLSLPHARARQIYSEWTTRVMRGEWADAALLAFDGSEVVAFISMLELPDVSAWSGEKVCGRGLGATLPEFTGLFTAIQREMIRQRPLDAAWMENETQAATVGSINVYAKLGFRYLRSTSSFHFRPGAAFAACVPD